MQVRQEGYEVLSHLKPGYSTMVVLSHLKPGYSTMVVLSYLKPDYQLISVAVRPATVLSGDKAGGRIT